MRITDDVRWDLPKEAYAAVSARFVDLCQECGLGPDKTGFFGEAGFPGVSDVDALAIGEAEALRRARRKHEELRGKWPEYGYLFWHQPLWILPAVVADAAELHTMDNLRCANGSSDRLLPGTTGDRKILQVIWALFLLDAATRMTVTSELGSPMSLRRLLLVHKNMHHTMVSFGNGERAGERPLLGADELRETAKNLCRRGETAELTVIVEAQLLGALEVACHRMDVVCGERVDVAGGPARDSGWIVTRGMLFQRAPTTAFHPGKRRIGLAPPAFRVAKDHLYGRSECAEMSRYLAAEKRCRLAYGRAGVEYPFIAPLAVARCGWRRGIVTAVNRLMDAIWGAP